MRVLASWLKVRPSTLYLELQLVMHLFTIQLGHSKLRVNIMFRLGNLRHSYVSEGMHRSAVQKSQVINTHQFCPGIH